MEFYFLALNGLTLVCFGAIFLILYRREKRLTHSLYFSHAYFYCATAFVLDIVAPSAFGHFWAAALSYAFFSLAIFTVVKGVYLRYQQTFPARLVGGLLIAGEVIMIAVMYWHSVALGRVTFSLLMAPVFGISIIAALARRDHILDKLVLGTLCLGATIMTVHPVTTGLTIFFPYIFGTYSETVHALVIYFSVSLLAIPLGAVLLFATAMEIFTNLYSKSITDGLTGLLNKSSFEDMVRETMKETRTSALIVCDIDHFKQINDTEGHAAGDNVIRQIAAVLKRSAERSGMAGRIGGEEFCVFLPVANADMALLFAENLRTQIAFTGLKNCGKPVTMSFGVATMKDGETYDSLFARGDQALYSAKNSGRNRACLAQFSCASTRSEAAASVA